MRIHGPKLTDKSQHFKKKMLTSIWSKPRPNMCHKQTTKTRKLNKREPGKYISGTGRETHPSQSQH